MSCPTKINAGAFLFMAARNFQHNQPFSGRRRLDIMVGAGVAAFVLIMSLCCCGEIPAAGFVACLGLAFRRVYGGSISISPVYAWPFASRYLGCAPVLGWTPIIIINERIGEGAETQGVFRHRFSPRYKRTYKFRDGRHAISQRH